MIEDAILHNVLNHLCVMQKLLIDKGIIADEEFKAALEGHTPLTDILLDYSKKLDKEISDLLGDKYG